MDLKLFLRENFSILHFQLTFSRSTTRDGKGFSSTIIDSTPAILKFSLKHFFFSSKYVVLSDATLQAKSTRIVDPNSKFLTTLKKIALLF